MSMERLATGISGLDTMVGGIPAGRTVLVTGDAGTGKTILALQTAHSVSMQGLKTVYIATEEESGDLVAQGKSFGWDLAGMQAKGLLKVIDLAGQRSQEIESAVGMGIGPRKGNFVELLNGVPADTRFLVIDSIGSQTGSLVTNEFRDRFDHFVFLMKQKDLTALVVLDAATNREYNELALYSVHGAIRLQKRENPYTGRRERVMDIVKMRNTATPIQLLTYDITGAGIVVTATQEKNGNGTPPSSTNP